MNPANSMTSTNPTRAIPRTPFSVSLRRRGSSRIPGSVAVTLVPMSAVRGSMTGRQRRMEPRSLLPHSSMVPHDVGSNAREQENHEHQDDSQDPVNDRLLDIQVHEVLGHQVGLDQRHAEGGG